MSVKNLTILGAGPTGLLSAIYALKNNVKTTIIAKPNYKTASNAAGGMLAPMYEFFGKENKEFTEFALSSRELWNKILSTINTNSYALSETFDEKQRLFEIINVAKNYNLDLEIKTNKSAFNAKEYLELPLDGLIDPIEASNELLEYAISLGLKIIDDEIINIENQKLISKVKEYDFETLLIASGIGAKNLEHSLSDLTNLIPVSGFTIEFDCLPIEIGTFRKNTLYHLSRNNKTIIGATGTRDIENWEDAIGFEGFLEKVFNEFPHLKDKNIIEVRKGVRPTTPDNLPIIGASNNQNIYLACGSYRNGWLLAPKIAQIIIDNILFKTPISDLYNPERFRKLTKY